MSPPPAAAVLMVTAYLVARKRGYPTEPFPGLLAVAHLLAVAVPGLLLIAIIFGGVRSGVFTATESSCIAVIYALLITIFSFGHDLCAGVAELADAPDLGSGARKAYGFKSLRPHQKQLRFLRE